VTTVETIIIGAGPYGLSVAAHLRSAAIDHAIIGTPMESWRKHMPPAMVLKSERFASNLSDAQRRFTLERYCALRGVDYAAKGSPLPIGEFLNYADWFRQQAVPDVWNVKVRRLRWTGSAFELILDDRTVLANRVIVATGHVAFRYLPDALEYLGRDAPALVSHAADHCAFDAFRGRDVTVVGSGQSGLETAALLAEQGASVRVIARTPAVEWNSDVDAARSLAQRLRRPDAGLGDGWRSLAASELPRVFFFLPETIRRRIVATANGPSGAWWLKNRVLGRVPLLTSSEIIEASERGEKLRLSVRKADGTIDMTTDHIIAGTGYRVDIGKLPFLDPALRAAIKTSHGAPVLNLAFESSVPRLHFIGLASAQSFGPVMRFVYGAKHAAGILASHIRSAERRSASRKSARSATTRMLKTIAPR
jgi:FAD-dependent urate hydroxylase